MVNFLLKFATISFSIYKIKVKKYLNKWFTLVNPNFC